MDAWYPILGVAPERAILILYVFKCSVEERRHMHLGCHKQGCPQGLKVEFVIDEIQKLGRKHEERLHTTHEHVEAIRLLDIIDMVRRCKRRKC